MVTAVLILLSFFKFYFYSFFVLGAVTLQSCLNSSTELIAK